MTASFVFEKFCNPPSDAIKSGGVRAITFGTLEFVIIAVLAAQQVVFVGWGDERHQVEDRLISLSCEERVLRRWSGYAVFHEPVVSLKPEDRLAG